MNNLSLGYLESMLLTMSIPWDSWLALSSNASEGWENELKPLTVGAVHFIVEGCDAAGLKLNSTLTAKYFVCHGNKG